MAEVFEKTTQDPATAIAVFVMGLEWAKLQADGVDELDQRFAEVQDIANGIITAMRNREAESAQ